MSVQKLCLNCSILTDFEALAKYIGILGKNYFLCRNCDTMGNVCFSCGIKKPLSEFRIHLKNSEPYLSSLCESCDPTGIDDYHFIENIYLIHHDLLGVKFENFLELLRLENLKSVDNCKHAEAHEKHLEKIQEEINDPDVVFSKDPRDTFDYAGYSSSNPEIRSKWLLRSTYTAATINSYEDPYVISPQHRAEIKRQQGLKQGLTRLKQVGLGAINKHRHSEMTIGESSPLKAKSNSSLSGDRSVSIKAEYQALPKSAEQPLISSSKERAFAQKPGQFSLESFPNGQALRNAFMAQQGHTQSQNAHPSAPSTNFNLLNQSTLQVTQIKNAMFKPIIKTNFSGSILKDGATGNPTPLKPGRDLNR